MGSTSTLQGWRKAYGALKDTTKVGLAHVNSDYAVFSSPCHFLNTNKHTHTFILLFFFHCFSKYYLIRSSYLSIYRFLLIGIGRCHSQSHQPRRVSSQRQTPSKSVTPHFYIQFVPSFFILIIQ